MVRVAIVGLGAATRNIHLPAYQQLGDRVTVVGGCDVDPAARARVASKVGEVFESFEEMLARTRPDVLTIVTPPSHHRDQTLTALGLGCDVFCEKPFAESLEDADLIIDAADRAGRRVCVNSEFPAMRTHVAAKAMVGSEQFGRLLFLHASQAFRMTERTEAGWRGEMRRRLCFEFGVHVLELVRYYFDGMPSTLTCQMPCPPGSRSPEPVNLISLEYDDGRAASIVLDRLSSGPERYLDIRLDGECASIETSIGGELRVSLGVHAPERRPFVSLDVAAGGKAVLRNGRRSHVLAREGRNPFASATAAHFGRFLDARRTGEEPPASARDHRNTLALVLAAYKSAETKAPVELRSFASPGAFRDG